MIRTLGAVVAVVAVVASAGCSAVSSSETSLSASESTAPSSNATPAKGPKISGTGYSYNVPKGWGLSPQEIPGFDPDSVAFNLRDKDKFADNVNVLLSPGGKVTPDEAEEFAKQELTAAGVTDISVNDRVSVAGGESAHVTADMTMGGNDYTIEQFYPTADDQTMVMTFSFSRSLPAAERAKITDATLASWTWTD